MSSPNAAQRLRDVIEEEITQGVFRPGDRLDEVCLATRYRVSRTPVREALPQLAASGLVVSRPRRGTIVAAPSAEQVVEMFEVMAELEGMAGKLAARRADEEDRDRLLKSRESCRSVVASSDPDSYYYRNELFHDAIYLGQPQSLPFRAMRGLAPSPEALSTPAASFPGQARNVFRGTRVCCEGDPGSQPQRSAGAAAQPRHRSRRSLRRPHSLDPATQPAHRRSDLEINRPASPSIATTGE